MSTGRFKRYAEYKDSGVEWLGKIPADWIRCALSHVTVSRCDGPFGTSLKSEHYAASGVRVVRLQNIGSGVFRAGDEAFIDDAHARSLGDHSVNAGDVLIAGLGDEAHPVGRACVAPAGIGPAMVKADCFRFRLDQRQVIPAFAAYQLTSTAEVAAGSLATGATRARMNLTATSARQIALPALKEQRNIVEFVDRHSNEIDALVAKKELLIDLLQEKRTALITRAVTKGLDPNAPMKDSGIEGLGGIPEHWIADRVRRICSRVTDGAHISPDASSPDFPFVSTVDIKEGRIDFAGCLTTSSTSYAYMVRTGCRPMPGDVLFSKDGTIGTTAIVRIDRQFAVASSLVILSPIPDCVDSAWLDYWLNGLFVRSHLELLLSGAALRRVSVAKVGRLPIVFPSELTEQRAIVDFVDLQTGRIDALVAKVRNAIDRLRELRRALISAAVTGKIDVREEAA